MLTFEISGRFAHFRKFYTNSSSLSYLVPPRTAIIGLLASVLGRERDGYYEEFALDNIKISVAILHLAKRTTQSLNYLHNNYYKLLINGKGKVMHSQCKLELLIGQENKPIKYKIYVAAISDEGKKTLDNIKVNLDKNQCGYGVYFGQRQFIANIDKVKSIASNDIVHIEEADKLDTICLKDNCVEISSKDVFVVNEQMPIQMEKSDIGRKVQKVDRVIFERSGNRIEGRFKNCYQVKDKVISFYGD